MRVERAGAVTLHHSPPTADSAARRRARHLLRAPGARDELLRHDALRCAPPLPPGTVFEAVRGSRRRVVYGEGEDERILRAIQDALDDGIVHPTIIGRRRILSQKLPELLKFTTAK